uniref:Uncharacterized protein n=1 Tax=Rhizophora mucronata TaxID=61149 RepID=A0A2P2QCN9_RHIMU
MNMPSHSSAGLQTGHGLRGDGCCWFTRFGSVSSPISPAGLF